MSQLVAHTSAGDDRTTFGFWLYLMTDCILFASLFATYAVLHGATANGAGSKDIFDLHYVFIETVLLLTSSLTSGLAVVALRVADRRFLVAMLIATFTLGATFLGMELYEFSHLAAVGNGWTISAFLSAYFTLVGTHGLHITVALLWLLSSLVVLYRRGVTATFEKRLRLFTMFWHFLDIVWVLIFTLVYLFGALA